jgi:integrase
MIIVRKRIGLRDLKALAPNSEIIDAKVIGFRARRQTGPTVSFSLVYRSSTGEQRRVTIGRWGSPWTPETARAEATRLLGEVAAGLDPAQDKQERRHALTMNELFARYLDEARAGRVLGRGGRPKRASTVAFDEGAIRAHLAPLIGERKVADVTRQVVERLMFDIADGKTARAIKGKPRGVGRVTGGRGVATRVVGLLGGIMSHAVAHGMINSNPCARLRRFAGNPRTRRLSDDEYVALATGIRASEGSMWPPASAALKFLALTGWRSGEMLALRWRDVDLVRRTANLRETKTGASMRPLSFAAIDVLKSITRNSDSALVFPASRGDGPMAGFKRFAARIIDEAGLPSDVMVHTLRHSFASNANDIGLSDATIAMLIGHKGRSTTTSRYVHGADAVLLQAADQVANRISELMGVSARAPWSSSCARLERDATKRCVNLFT